MSKWKKKKKSKKSREKNEIEGKNRRRKRLEWVFNTNFERRAKQLTFSESTHSPNIFWVIKKKKKIRRIWIKTKNTKNAPPPKKNNSLSSFCD